MSMLRDFENNHKTTQVLSAVVTADANSTSVDMKGYDSLTFFGVTGASGDTLSGSVYFELEVEGSADNSTWVDATDAMLSTSVTGTNTGTFALVNDPAEDSLTYVTSVIKPQSYRYWRVVDNVTGTHTNGTPVTVVAVQGRAQTSPVV